MLFRSTSLSAARSLRGPGVMHPHGTVLSADAFARGVIRSGTDYSIYAQGMKGANFTSWHTRKLRGLTEFT